MREILALGIKRQINKFLNDLTFKVDNRLTFLKQQKISKKF